MEFRASGPHYKNNLSDLIVDFSLQEKRTQYKLSKSSQPFSTIHIIIWDVRFLLVTFNLAFAIASRQFKIESVYKI